MDKSIYLLCEYGISLDLVRVLKQENITLELIKSESTCLKSINGIATVKQRQIINATKAIYRHTKNNTVYELIEFGLSKAIIEMLLLKGVGLEDINESLCERFSIGTVTYGKIMNAFESYKAYYSQNFSIDAKGLLNRIRERFQHSEFTKEELVRYLSESLIETENLDELLESISLEKENETYKLSYDIIDLVKFDLPKRLLEILEKNDIRIEDIELGLSNKIKISKYREEQILTAYNNFKIANPLFVPNISENVILDCLRKEYKHRGFPIESIRRTLEDSGYKCNKNYEKILQKMFENNLLYKDEELCFVFYPKLEDELNKLGKGNKHNEIVIRKLQGETLESIGRSYGVTRERIRQIFSKQLKKLPNVHEEKYEDIFCDYMFDINSFCEVFSEKPSTYYYLREKYKIGEKELYELINDSRLNDTQKMYVRKRYNIIQYNGENVFVNRLSIILAYLKSKERQVEFSELNEAYNQILKDYNLELEEMTKEDFRNVEACLGRSPFVLNNLKRYYRYYNCIDIDEQEIIELKQMLDVEPGIYSSEVFFNDNTLLMKKLDIRDEYELHNFLRKVLGSYDENIVFSRMPDIYIHCDDKMAFFEEKIQENSPISVDDFCEYIYTNYGHKKSTFKTFLTSNFGHYINIENNVNILTSDCPLFDENQQQFMKNYLQEDIYSISTLKMILNDEFDVNDFRLINSLNFKQLGYKVRGNYIMKSSISNLETYLRENVSNSDYYNIPSEMKKIGSTFTSYMHKFIYEKLIFRIDEDRYITIKALNKMGITNEDIEEFIENVTDIIPENEYFNLFTLSTKLKSKLFDYELPNCFYETIIMTIDNVKLLYVKNNMLFIKTNETATREKFINSFIVKNIMYIYEIRKAIETKYNINLLESYIKNFINTNKFYVHSNTNCIYSSKKEYEKEVEEWDILKLID